MEQSGVDLDAARGRLIAAREQLGRSLGALRAEMDTDGPISVSSDAGADTAAAEQQEELRGELDAQLAEVEAALARVDDGTYGIDEETGEPIDLARLEAIPTARTNI